MSDQVPDQPLDPRLASAIATVRAAIETAATALDSAQVALGSLLAQLPRGENERARVTPGPDGCSHPADSSSIIDTPQGRMMVCGDCGANELI